MHNHFDLDTSNLFGTATLLTTRGHIYKLFKSQATSKMRPSYLFYCTGNQQLETFTWLHG